MSFKILRENNYLPSGPLFFTIENPYSKFILAIKTLSVDRFSKLLQVLLEHIEI